MKLLHLADLHLGKRVNGFSMLEDQAYILDQLLALVDSQQPDCVLLCGDVYDKPVPPAEAVQLFDGFLSSLSRRGVQVMLISGNHDSPERLAFGGQLMAGSGVHVAPVYGGAVEPVTLEDAFGPVRFYLLPFLKPAHVRRFYPEAAIESYTDALHLAVVQMVLDPAVRNVLLTHQFVTGAERAESEELNVGGADNVDAAVFAGFDYVALGHLHRPQRAGAETIRYAGSPLSYSFSEAEQEKSAALVKLGPKGTVDVRLLPLRPLHGMKRLRGSYQALTRRDFYDGAPWRGDYLHITLTDETDVPDAIGKLRVIYPNLMRLEYDNSRTRAAGQLESLAQQEQRTPLELFAAFYRQQNGQDMSREQQDFVQTLITSIWEGEA